MTFEIHHQLIKDCYALGELDLCRLLLMNDSRYPWFILVPQRPGITESYQLSESDQIQLNRESTYLSKKLATAFSADKMNVAALGNVVPQLHIHHIVRYKDDQAWPAPVWGTGKPAAYEPNNLERVRNIGEIILADF